MNAEVLKLQNLVLEVSQWSTTNETYLQMKTHLSSKTRFSKLQVKLPMIHHLDGDTLTTFIYLHITTIRRSHPSPLLPMSLGIEGW